MVLGKLILDSEQILALVITMVLTEMMKVDSKKFKKKGNWYYLCFKSLIVEDV